MGPDMRLLATLAIMTTPSQGLVVLKFFDAAASLGQRPMSPSIGHLIGIIIGCNRF